MIDEACCCHDRHGGPRLQCDARHLLRNLCQHDVLSVTRSTLVNPEIWMDHRRDGGGLQRAVRYDTHWQGILHSECQRRNERTAPMTIENSRVSGRWGKGRRILKDEYGGEGCEHQSRSSSTIT